MFLFAIDSGVVREHVCQCAKFLSRSVRLHAMCSCFQETTNEAIAACVSTPFCRSTIIFVSYHHDMTADAEWRASRSVGNDYLHMALQPAVGVHTCLGSISI